VVFEPTETEWSAYVPDLPGCVSTGKTRDEVEQHIQEEAVTAQLAVMHEFGEPIPKPFARRPSSFPS
jgi:predicted RNase H-like HicB family nuclease